MKDSYILMQLDMQWKNHLIQEKNGKAKPTRILYKSNLSHIMMKEYLKDLLTRGLIKETIAKDSKAGRTYSLTSKGTDYLSQYRTIVSFMDSFGLNEEED